MVINNSIILNKISIFFYLIIVSFPSVVRANSLPTTTEFMNILTICGAGSKFKIEGDMLREAESVYEKGRTQGRGLQEIVATIMDQLPEAEKSAAYRDYLGCIRDFVNPKRSQLLINGGMPYEGKYFELDIGVLPVGLPYSIKLAIVPPRAIREAKFSTDTNALKAIWPNGSNQMAIDTQYNQFLLVISQDIKLYGPQQHQVMLLADRQLLIRITVKYRLEPASVERENDSGSKTSGRGQDSSAPDTVCVKAPSSSYEVKTKRGWLTGDRNCNEWSTCSVNIENDGSQACIIFTLQGHSECTSFFSNCDAVRTSIAHISAVFALKLPNPILRMISE